MEKLCIEGDQRINGQIRVSGSKNSAVKLLAASLLTDKEIILHNFPYLLEDVKEKINIMRQMGSQISLHENFIRLISKEITNDLKDYTCNIRTTYLLAPSQLHRLGIARIPYPGGCKIGERKYDLHFMVWKAMGATVEELPDYIEIRCEGRLKGTDIVFPFPTMGGTENALLCGVLAQGITNIYNAYVSPEVADLIAMLVSMGADITVDGNSFITITGVANLNGTSHEVIPDRIEALTWMIAAMITKGRLLLTEVPFAHMEVPLIHLRHIGLDFFSNSNSIYINTADLPYKINPFEIACGTYPGVVSDMQPFFSVLASQAKGVSRIIDYRYPERFGYIGELQKMGDGYDVRPGEVVVKGKIEFKGNIVRAVDLRGGAAILLGALIAKGRTEIENYKMILRGYNGLLEKLQGVGISLKVEG
ncbi:MAG: UDP-N-acetylglucosamine 1-carboxyvinyltransferase [Candidatus Omnitrophica bacterium]|nr:UDP-N-acetylglucosamine 1-carboxyvinyltransferase [Candidatus Omnitrophota bacterium]